MKKIFFIISLVISFNVYGYETKEMVCTEFSKDTSFRKVFNKFTIRYDLSTNNLNINFENNKNIGFIKWSVIDVNLQKSRVTGFSIRKVNQNSLESPIQVIDIDFSKPRISFTNFGGPIDFDEIFYTPSTIECVRSN